MNETTESPPSKDRTRQEFSKQGTQGVYATRQEEEGSDEISRGKTGFLWTSTLDHQQGTPLLITCKDSPTINREITVKAELLQCGDRDHLKREFRWIRVTMSMLVDSSPRDSARLAVGLTAPAKSLILPRMSSCILSRILPIISMKKPRLKTFRDLLLPWSRLRSLQSLGASALGLSGSILSICSSS
ncbi:hypothetical protein Droror1_Dr00027608 [Drosera rotundifolia]